MTKKLGTGSDSSRKRAAAAAANAVAEITRNIESGEWAAGYQLPTERELQARLGIARNTVRKGLKVLEDQGRIVRLVGRGSFVSQPPPPEAENDNIVNQIMGCSPKEVMEVRLLIEPWGASLAAVHANAADLRHLWQCVEQSDGAVDIETFERWDSELHKTMVSAARHDLLGILYQAIDTVRDQPEWVKLKERTVSPEQVRLYHSHHREIVTAISDRNAALAEELVRKHLLDVQHTLTGL